MQSLSIIDQVEFYRHLYDGVGGGGRGTNLTPNITFKQGEFTKEGSIQGPRRGRGWGALAPPLFCKNKNKFNKK